MRDTAESYRREWAGKTGRPESDVYVPAALLAAERAEQQAPELTLGEQVLAEVKTRYAEYLEYGNGPNLRDADHEGLPEGSFSIDWEGGPYEWAYGYETAVPGAFVEPIFGFVLGVHPDDDELDDGRHAASNF